MDIQLKIKGRKLPVNLRVVPKELVTLPDLPQEIVLNDFYSGNEARLTFYHIQEIENLIEQLSDAVKNMRVDKALEAERRHQLVLKRLHALETSIKQEETNK